MEFIGFQRQINDVVFGVYIERELYGGNSLFFQCLFSTYIRSEQLTASEKSVYIVSQKEVQGIDFKNIIICNTSERDWGLRLIGLLEEWYADQLNCTIIHGSCVIINHKNVLIVGKRKTGKTTLTGYLTIHEKAVYLDDDCVYIVNNEFWGFNMPISVRANVDSLKENNIVEKFVDGENIERKMFCAERTVGNVSKVNTIIFPSYNEEGINYISLMSKGEAFKEILSNVRHSENSRKTFEDISNLIRGAKAFHVTYNNSENALRLIKSVI